jgi:hypothetical protein
MLHLTLHLCGNVQKWIVAGLGGAGDVRDRPAEFSERGVDEARAVPARRTARQLPESRHIRGFDVTGLKAIFDGVPHFRGHTQEIIGMTRLQLGDAYTFARMPTTPEQGGPT